MTEQKNQQELNKKIIEQNELLFKFIGSLSLFYQEGDIYGAIDRVLGLLKVKINWDYSQSLDSLRITLGKNYGVTTLYNSPLCDYDEDN